MRLPWSPFPVIALLSLARVSLGAIAAAASSEGQHSDSVSLNGAWEFVLVDGDEHAETPEGASGLHWQGATLPGASMPWDAMVARDTRFAWARRTFSVSGEQAGRRAVLRWNEIHSGAVACINGRKVGEHAPTGPYQVLLPAGTLSAGGNTIVLKLAGAAGVVKADDATRAPRCHALWDTPGTGWRRRPAGCRGY